MFSERVSDDIPPQMKNLKLLFYKYIVHTISENYHTPLPEFPYKLDTLKLFSGYWQLLSSADNLCKQFEPRSGPTFCRA